MRRRRRRRTVCLSVVYRSPSSSTVVIQCCLLHAFSSLLSSLYNKCSSFNSSLGNILRFASNFLNLRQRTNPLTMHQELWTHSIALSGHLLQHYPAGRFENNGAYFRALLCEAFVYHIFVPIILSLWIISLRQQILRGNDPNSCINDFIIDHPILTAHACRRQCCILLWPLLNCIRFVCWETSASIRIFSRPIYSG